MGHPILIIYGRTIDISAEPISIAGQAYSSSRRELIRRLGELELELSKYDRCRMFLRTYIYN